MMKQSTGKWLKGELTVKNQFEVHATLVANEFIDTYMASANGEYVKVYLYLLRHQNETVDPVSIADALNHTEADVRRAVAYWQKMGVLQASEEGKAEQETAAALPGAQDDEKEKKQEKRRNYGKADLEKLQKDGEFSQLLYVAGQYMGRLLKPQDADMLAYLYDGLHMPCDVIEYLIEYCVQNGHSSIRYMEKVALNWHERGITGLADAKAFAERFSEDAFAVMKAFGINDRRPGNMEWEAIERWYRNWGFTRQMVVEACNRTMQAIHKPSFQYADRILQEWYRNGIRTLEAAAEADGKRKKTGQRQETPRRSNNQFRNFEEREIDYDAMMLEQWQ